MRSIFVNFFSVFLLVLIFSHAKSNELEDEIRGNSELIIDTIKKNSSIMDASQIEKIKLIFPNTLSFSHVGAFRESGEYKISLNVGSYIRFVELSSALRLTFLGITGQDYLFGYIRYLAYAELFGNTFMTAAQYAHHYDVKNIQDKLSTFSKAPNNLNKNLNDSVLFFVIAHEVGHIINGDTDSIASSLSEKKERERKADEWASDASLRAGLNPTPAVFSLLIFNEAEGRKGFLEGMNPHPASMTRVVALLDNVNSYTATNRSKHPKANEILEAVSTIKDMMVERANLQEKINKPDELKNSAKNGDRFSQLKVGERYLDDSDDFPHDAKKATNWFEIAAFNKTKFDYVDQAAANYQAGFMYGFNQEMDKDVKRACFYLKKAAVEGYLMAIHALKQLTAKPECN